MAQNAVNAPLQVSPADAAKPFAPMNTTTDRSSAPRLRTRVTDLLKIKHPVILGGMSGGTNPELVAAVSNAGGLGIHGVTMITADAIGQDTARIRALTSQPFGLNLLLFATNEALLDAVLAERPAVVSFAWANADQPLEAIFAKAHDAGSLVMHMVSTVHEAARTAEAGADIIVAQGTEGGGHVGVMGTMALVPQVVTAVQPIPVLAAGGIADGRGLAAALALGAEGVLVGTRFLATPESAIHPNFKQAIVDSDGHDTDLNEIPDIIRGQVWPGAFSRARRNALIREWAGREWELRQRRPQVAPEVMAARAAGDVDRAVLFYGQDAGLIHAIEPAGDIVIRMVREAHDVIARQASGLLEPAAGRREA